MSRVANAHYEIENVTIRRGDLVHLGTNDEVVGCVWDHPYTYLTILRFVGNHIDDDERIAREHSA